MICGLGRVRQWMATREGAGMGASSFRTVATALSAVVVLLLAPARALGALHWRVLHVKVPGVSNDWHFGDVSCQSALKCLAVGFYYPQDQTQNDWPGVGVWNGLRWTVRPSGDRGTASFYASAVSCAPAAICMTVNNETTGKGPIAVWRWTTETWSYPRPPWSSSHAHQYLPSGVSCVSANECMVVGAQTGGLFAAAWDGHRWSLRSMPIPPGGPLKLFANQFSDALGPVSCSSPVSCTAVGNVSGGNSFAERWDGHTWSVQQLPKPAKGAALAVTGISCPSAYECIASGSWTPTNSQENHPYFAQWHPTGWAFQTVAIPATPAEPVTGVSCVSANSCLAVVDNTIFVRWNGTNWSGVRVTGPTWGIGALSCISAAVCVAWAGANVETTAPALRASDADVQPTRASQSH